MAAPLALTSGPLAYLLPPPGRVFAQLLGRLLSAPKHQLFRDAFYHHLCLLGLPLSHPQLKRHYGVYYSVVYAEYFYFVTALTTTCKLLYLSLPTAR